MLCNFQHPPGSGRLRSFIASRGSFPAAACVPVHRQLVAGRRRRPGRQRVRCMVLEPEAEPVFHPDSYGYRPGRSSLQAVAAARQRCWENDWAIDMDIRAFFDTVPWDLVLRAVKHHTRKPWVLLYVKRWLEAPLQQPDGTVTARTMGTPQGSAIAFAG